MCSADGRPVSIASTCADDPRRFATSRAIGSRGAGSVGANSDRISSWLALRYRRLLSRPRLSATYAHSRLNAGVREYEGPVDRQPLGDVPGDGVSVQQRRLPVTRRARQEAGAQLDLATANLDAQGASLRIGRGNRASIAVLEVERPLAALHDDPITDGKRTAAELQLLIPEPAGTP